MEARIPTSAVADVAGCTPADIKSWVHHGHIAVSPTESGKARLWDREDVLHVAIVAALVRTGVVVGQAAQVAMFAQSNPQKFGTSHGRLVLAAARLADPDGYAVDILPASSSARDVLDALTQGGWRPAAALIVDLTEILGRIEAAFNQSA